MGRKQICRLKFQESVHELVLYDSVDSGVHFEKFILEIGAHHVYPGFLSWS